MDSPSPPGVRMKMKNALRNNYDKICEQVKQAETIIILNVDLVLAEDSLSPKAKELLETIKKQTWRIDKLLQKGGEKV